MEGAGSNLIDIQIKKKKKGSRVEDSLNPLMSSWLVGFFPLSSTYGLGCRRCDIQIKRIIKKYNFIPQQPWRTLISTEPFPMPFICVGVFMHVLQ